MRIRRNLIAVITMLALAIVTSCGQQTPPPPATQDQLALETTAPIIASPSALLPTEQTGSATPATSPPVEPTATYTPEIVATRPEDIVGVWLVRRFVAPLSETAYAAHLTFREDATFSFDDIDSGMHIFSGILRFADGQVTLVSDECWDAAKGAFLHCEMPFIIYSESQSGLPARIRFQSTGGTGVFIDNIGGKALLLDKRK